MLGVDGALLGHHVPGAVGALVERLDLVVLDDVRAVFSRGDGIGKHGAGGVHVALAIRPQAAEHTGNVHDGALLLDLRRRHQVAVLDADGLKDTVGGLQPFPACRRRGHGDAAGHVQADVLAGFLLDLREQVDGVRLQRRHVGIGIEGVDASCRMPGGACRQHRALDDGDIGPAEFGQVVENRSADDASPDNDDPIMRFHFFTRAVTRPPPVQYAPRPTAKGSVPLADR